MSPSDNAFQISPVSGSEVRLTKRSARMGPSEASIEINAALKLSIFSSNPFASSNLNSNATLFPHLGLSGLGQLSGLWRAHIQLKIDDPKIVVCFFNRLHGQRTCRNDFIERFPKSARDPRPLNAWPTIDFGICVAEICVNFLQSVACARQLSRLRGIRGASAKLFSSLKERRRKLFDLTELEEIRRNSFDLH